MEITGGHIAVQLNEDMNIIEITLFDEDEFITGLINRELAALLVEGLKNMIDVMEDVEWENQALSVSGGKNTGLLH